MRGTAIELKSRAVEMQKRVSASDRKTQRVKVVVVVGKKKMGVVGARDDESCRFGRWRTELER